MKKVVIFLIILTCSLFSVGISIAITDYSKINNYKPGSEPDGFRGIKWGTDIKTIKGMIHIGTDPSYGGTEQYIKSGDELRIGGAELKGIIYKFWRGKFSYVGIVSKGYSNWQNLKKAVFEKYGSVSKPNEYIEQYFWYGNKTGIFLGYSELSELCKLHIFSVELLQKENEYDNQKAKEGAEKGF